MKASKSQLAQIMVSAWAIAKSAALKFGGSSRQYLAGALRAAWAAIKAPAKIVKKFISLELEQIGGNKPWIAKITGKDEKFGLARTFENGVRDYSRANKPKTRGVYSEYTLDDGIYEVNAPTAWGKVDRYFAQVIGGELARIDAKTIATLVA